MGFRFLEIGVIPRPITRFHQDLYLGSAEKLFRGGRVWGVGCGLRP